MIKKIFSNRKNAVFVLCAILCFISALLAFLEFFVAGSIIIAIAGFVGIMNECIDQNNE